MEYFALYLLKSAVWLTGFSLVYFLFLRNERFFRIKRIYLLAGIIISLLFPLISFQYQVELPAPLLTDTPTVDGNLLSAYETSASPVSLNWKNFLLVAYFSGLIILAARLGKSISNLSGMIRKNVSSVHGSSRIIRVHGIKSPFSFINYIFISPSLGSQDTEQILCHEEVHVKQKHWLDLLFAELVRMLQWANPFAWVYAGFIRQNHEYLADEAVLQKSSDPSVYKAVLMNQMFNVPVIPLSNSFSYSTSKKRFDMMKKIVTSPYRKLRILFILPVAALVFYAFATPEYIDSSLFPDGTVKGKVLNEENKPMFGVVVTLSDGTASITTHENGTFTMPDVPENAALVFTYFGYKSLKLNVLFNQEMVVRMTKDPEITPADLKVVPPPITPSGQEPDRPLMVVDGVIRETTEWIDPNSISTISILKDESATAVFGEKGKNGVVIVTLKKSAGSQENKNVRGNISTINGKPLEGATIQIKGTTIGTITDNKGSFRLENISGESSLIVTYIGYKAKIVKPDFISAMTIKLLQDTVNLSSIGVPPPPPPPPSADGGIGIRSENGEKPLYVVDGEIRNDISGISPDMIKSVNVLKGSSSVKLYGEKGKNGVVLITTKDTSAESNDNESPAVPENKNAMVLVEEMPMFVGGEAALQKYIYGNIKVPGSVDKSQLKNPVRVVFVVSSTGKISHVSVAKPVQPLLDAEAVRVVSAMPDWQPGRQNGTPVDVIYQLPIDFNPAAIKTNR